MKELALASIREIEVKILNEVSTFCEHNDIRYFLSSGTLLGAVRHKGFIPWDDDIDIMLPRPDYEKFLEYFKSSASLKIHYYTTDDKYFFPFIKVSDASTILKRPGFNTQYGVNIDIFPIDGAPDNDEEIKLRLKKIARYKLWAYIKSTRSFKTNNPVKKLGFICLKIALSIIPAKKILANMNKLGASTDYNSASRRGMVTWGYGLKEICPKQVFDEAVMVEFENDFYRCPKGYKTYLSNLYGDYKQLPPVEKRVTNHNFRAYAKTYEESKALG